MMQFVSYDSVELVDSYRCEVYTISWRKCKKWSDKSHRLTPTFQVIPGHGNPQKRRTMLGGYLLRYFALDTKRFTKYLRTHPGKEIHTTQIFLR